MFSRAPQPVADPMNSYMNGSSNYHGLPTTAHPVQQVWSPMPMSSMSSHTQTPVFRDNSTALTYTHEQMLSFMWQQDPLNPRHEVLQEPEELEDHGGYTDLTTGLTYTHQQMMERTRKILTERASKKAAHNAQDQPFQSLQEQLLLQELLQLQPNGQARPDEHSLQQYTDRQFIDSQRRREIQGHRMAEKQAQMHQAPRLQPPVPNAGLPVLTDSFGRQWTQDEYDELVQRQQVRKAQAWAAINTGSQPQAQQVQQVSPPGMNSPHYSSPLTNYNHLMTIPNHVDLLPRQQGNMGPPLAPVNPRTQSQNQQTSPLRTMGLQQSLITDQSGRQWTREQWSEMERRIKAQKSLLPPSKTPKATKTPIPTNPSTQPTAHKQRVSKAQTQSRQWPTASVTQSKEPQTINAVEQAETAKSETTFDTILKESFIQAINSVSPPTSGLQSTPPNQISTPDQPVVDTPDPLHSNSQSLLASNQHHHHTVVRMADVENGTRIKDSISSFLSSRQQVRHKTFAHFDDNNGSSSRTAS
jgi:hypothetical protein